MFGGTDGRDDALADAGNDRLFRRSANQLLQVRADRHPGSNAQFHAVLGDGAERRLAAAARIGTIDDLRMDAGPHRIHHIASRQVDGRRSIEVQVDVRPMRRDDGMDHVHHVAARQIMSLQARRADAGAAIDVQAGLRGHDLRLHDDPRVHLAKSHAHQARKTHVGVRHERLKPQLAVDGNEDDEHQPDEQGHGRDGIHDKHPPLESRGRLRAGRAKQVVPLGEQKCELTDHELHPF